MGPLIGYLIDRYSIRLLCIVGIAVQGMALYLLSRVHTPRAAAHHQRAYPDLDPTAGYSKKG